MREKVKEGRATLLFIGSIKADFWLSSDLVRKCERVIFRMNNSI